MKNNFKYALLIFLISFLIAKICSGLHKTYESYSDYPFTQNDYSLEDLQTVLLRYNNIVDNSTLAGAIDYNVPNILKQMNDDIQDERERIIYSKLSDTLPSYGNYMPFNSKILPSNYASIKEDSEKIIKGEKIVINPEKEVESLLAQSLEPQVEGGLGTLENIAERGVTGEIYSEENSCVGGWSEWDVSNCGNSKNKCGIMFKKYEITQIEKNDENGIGKKCDYLDGIIKYKYCVGDSGDDYESNMERCDLATNMCPCKLNEETVINVGGEKVYDLEDKDCLYQLQKDCICPRGYTTHLVSDICKLTPGVDCSIEETGCIYTASSDTQEEKCEIPLFMNKKLENDFYANYNQIDGSCKKMDCSCSNGTDIEEGGCFVDGMPMCNKETPCDQGYYLSGNPPNCKQQNTVENSYKECSCLYGSPFVSSNSNDISICDPQNTNYDNTKIVQNCATSGCSPGYELAVNTSSGQSATNKCNQYYPESLYQNINCCYPLFDTCLLEDTELNLKNIVRKDSDSMYETLSNMEISELREKYTEVTGETISSDELLSMGENYMSFLIQEIIKNMDNQESENQCFGNLDIDECFSEFKCKPGYSFLPTTNYENEHELRMIGCETRDTSETIKTCNPSLNCLSKTVQNITFDISSGEFRADGQKCMFSSDITVNDIESVCRKNNLDCPTDLTTTVIKCGVPDENDICNLQQTECTFKTKTIYYPSWNGTCVPVTCNYSDEIKQVYSIPSTYENCTSGDLNCGMGTISCKESEYEVPNSLRMIYCDSPRKVGSDYLTKDYELFDSGCSTDPQERTVADQARRERMSSQGGIINENAEELASQREGPNVDNIGEEADLSGTTSSEQSALETALEQDRQEVSAQSAAVGGGNNNDPLNPQERLASYGTPTVP